MSSGIIFWDDITLFWDEHLLDDRFFSVEKVNKLVIGPKQVFFSIYQLKKKIIDFHPKITSKNNHPGGHEKDFSVQKPDLNPGFAGFGSGNPDLDMSQIQPQT